MEYINIIGKIISPILTYIFNKKTIYDIIENKNTEIFKLTGEDIGVTNLNISYYRDIGNVDSVIDLILDKKNIFIYGASGIGKNRSIYEILAGNSDKLSNYNFYLIDLKKWINFEDKINFLPKDDTIILIDNIFEYKENELDFLYKQIEKLQVYTEFGNNISFILLCDSKMIPSFLEKKYGDKLFNLLEKIELKIRNESDFFDFCIKNYLIEDFKEFKKYFDGTPASIITKKISGEKKLDDLLSEYIYLKELFLILKLLNTYLVRNKINKRTLILLLGEFFGGNYDFNIGINKLRKEGFLSETNGIIKFHESTLNLIGNDENIDVKIIDILFKFIIENLNGDFLEGDLILLGRYKRILTGNIDIFERIVNSLKISYHIKNSAYISIVNHYLLEKIDILKFKGIHGIREKDFKKVAYLNKQIDFFFKKINEKYINELENGFSFKSNTCLKKLGIFIENSNILNFNNFDSAIDDLIEYAEFINNPIYRLNALDYKIKSYMDGITYLGEDDFLKQKNIEEKLKTIKEKLEININFINDFIKRNNIIFIQHFSDIYCNTVTFYNSFYKIYNKITQSDLIEKFIDDKYKYALEQEKLYNNSKDLSLIQDSYGVYKSDLLNKLKNGKALSEDDLTQILNMLGTVIS